MTHATTHAKTRLQLADLIWTRVGVAHMTHTSTCAHMTHMTHGRSGMQLGGRGPHDPRAAALAHVAVQHTCLGNVCLGNGCLGNGCLGNGCLGNGCLGNGCLGNGCLGMGVLQCSIREGGVGPAAGRSRWRRVREQNFFNPQAVTRQVVIHSRA